MELESGITEIIGEQGVGKTKFALNLCRGYPSIYISPYIISHQILEKDIIPLRIDTLLKLKMYLNFELSIQIIKDKIECLIIDGLDSFMYTLHRPRKHYADIFYMVKILKRICFYKGLKVIIVNCSYSSWYIDGYHIFNKYLGMGWCYAANRRLIISKCSNGLRKLNSIMGMKKIEIMFQITDNGVIYVDL